MLMLMLMHLQDRLELDPSHDMASHSMAWHDKFLSKSRLVSQYPLGPRPLSGNRTPPAPEEAHQQASVANRLGKATLAPAEPCCLSRSTVGDPMYLEPDRAMPNSW